MCAKLQGLAENTGTSGMQSLNKGDILASSTQKREEVRDGPACGDGGAISVGQPDRTPCRHVQRIKTLAVKLNMPEDRVVAALETMGEAGRGGG